MDPTKLMAVWDWKPPTSVKVVWSFIRFCNFYWIFIPNFYALTWPPHDLMKKGIPFMWKGGQDTAFIKLKEIFLSTLVIHMPDVSKPFYVMTNASLTTSGGGAYASWFQWRSPPLYLPFPNLLPSWAKLQHLWLRTPHCTPCPEGVEASPHRNCPPGHHYHRSQKPWVLQTTPKSDTVTGKVDAFPTRLQSHLEDGTRG